MERCEDSNRSVARFTLATYCESKVTSIFVMSNGCQEIVGTRAEVETTGFRGKPGDWMPPRTTTQSMTLPKLGATL